MSSPVKVRVVTAEESSAKKKNASISYRILYNPLAVLSRNHALVAGTLTVLIFAVVAWWGGVHPDGVIGMHVTEKAPSFKLIAEELVFVWLSLGCLFYIISRIFGGGGRVVSHLAVAGMSRLPYIIVALLLSHHTLGDSILQMIRSNRVQSMLLPQDMVAPGLAVASYAILGLIVWGIMMLFFGYKEAAKLHGVRAIASFVIGLALAEIISVTFIAWLVGVQDV